MQTNIAVIGAFATLLVTIVAVSLLVWDGSIGGDLYMAAVIGPTVGGIVGFVAGTKGVQQGSQATSNPPPNA
jgi:hypothetical protein